MKHTLCTLLLICAASVALIGVDAQAARSKPHPRTMILVGPNQLVPSCPPAFPQDDQGVGAFPELALSEPELAYSGGYQYDDSQDFACFVAPSVDARPGQASVDHWLANTRLLPTFPQIENGFFLPIGWQWIEFDR